MKIQVIICFLAALFTLNQSFAQTTFNPSTNDIYTINSPFTAYDITNKHGTGIAEMGSIPYNQWIFEKADDNSFRIKEVKTGKYLHIQNEGIEVGDIQSNWWSALWELEHVNDNYYRIKCKWHKYGAPLYLQNPQRSLSIGELGDKNAKYGRWRVRKVNAAPTPPASTPTTPTPPPANDNVCQIRFINKNSTTVNYYNIDETIRGSIGGKAEKTLKCKVGDTYSFVMDMENAANGSVINDFTISKNGCGTNHEIKISQIPWSANNLKGTKILENYTASRHSFDILKIDPVFIATPLNETVSVLDNQEIAGGMGKQVFASLTHNSTNWRIVDGKYGLENHFTKHNDNTGLSTTKTEMAFTSYDFARSFSGNIEFSGGAKGVKGTNSAAFNYADSKSRSNKSVFVFSRETATKFRLKLEESEVVFTDDFIETIINLSSSASYQNFIETWGTHYPKRTNYGGMRVAVTNIDITKVGSTQGWGVDVKQKVEADLKKVEASREIGFGYSQSESWDNDNSNSETTVFYKGGEGNASNWKVTDGSVQPVALELARLSNLLQDPAKFNWKINQADLDKKRRELEKAISGYMGSDTDDGKPIRPKMYKLSDFEWKLVDGEGDYDYANVFGAIESYVTTDSKNVTEFGRTIYLKTEEQKVEAKENKVHACDYNGFDDIYLTSVPNAGGGYSPFVFGIEHGLTNWHWGWVKQEGQYNMEKMYVEVSPYDSTVGLIENGKVPNPQSCKSATTISKQFANDQGTIEISFKIQEVALPRSWGLGF